MIHKQTIFREFPTRHTWSRGLGWAIIFVLDIGGVVNLQTFLPRRKTDIPMASLNDEQRQRFISILCRYPYVILDGAEDPAEDDKSVAITKKARSIPRHLIVDANDSEMGNRSVEADRGL